MKNKHTISKTPMYHIYFHDGRFYIDMYESNKPIHSYETIEAVKEALYYAGKIESKTAEI